MMQAPITTLKCIVFIHFVLTSFAALDPLFPSSYAFVQGFYIILGVWGLLQTDNPLPMEMMLTTNILSIILDIVVLGIYYPATPNSGVSKFAGGMCILNLLIKPFTGFLQYRILQERGGEYGGFSLPGGLSVSGLPAAFARGGSQTDRGGTYQNIDPETAPVMHS